MSINVYEYNDGFYITNTDKWIPKNLNLTVNLQVYKKFDIDFDANTRPNRFELSHRYNDWFNIIVDKCPLFYSVLKNQNWPEEEMRSLFVFIGRCLYKNGEHDNWNVIPMILGPYGTGKTTILTIVRSFFKSEHAKHISHNDSISILSGNRLDGIRFITHITHSFGTIYPYFNNIAFGSKKFTGNLFVEGNCVPQNIYINMLKIFNFNNKQAQINVKIMTAETGHVLHACNRAYLEVFKKQVLILKLNDDLSDCVFEYL